MMLMNWRLGWVAALPIFLILSSPVEGGGKLTGKPLASVSSYKDSGTASLQEIVDSNADKHGSDGDAAEENTDDKHLGDEFGDREEIWSGQINSREQDAPLKDVHHSNGAGKSDGKGFVLHLLDDGDNVAMGDDVVPDIALGSGFDHKGHVASYIEEVTKDQKRYIALGGGDGLGKDFTYDHLKHDNQSKDDHQEGQQGGDDEGVQMAVPEPRTWLLMGSLLLIMMLGMARRKWVHGKTKA